MYGYIMNEWKEHLFDFEPRPLGFSPTFASSSSVLDLGQVGSSYHASVSSSLKWKENKVAPPCRLFRVLLLQIGRDKVCQRTL